MTNRPHNKTTGKIGKRSFASDARAVAIGGEAIQYAEESLTIHEQLEDPYAAKVRAQIAAWREESDSE